MSQQAKGYFEISPRMLAGLMGLPETIDVDIVEACIDADCFYIRVASNEPVEGFTMKIPEGGSIPRIESDVLHQANLDRMKRIAANFAAEEDTRI